MSSFCRSLDQWRTHHNINNEAFAELLGVLQNELTFQSAVSSCFHDTAFALAPESAVVEQALASASVELSNAAMDESSLFPSYDPILCTLSGFIDPSTSAQGIGLQADWETITTANSTPNVAFGTFDFMADLSNVVEQSGEGQLPGVSNVAISTPEETAVPPAHGPVIATKPLSYWGSDSTTPCARCCFHKQKCRPAPNGILCARCTGLPARVCARFRITDERIFMKWGHAVYLAQSQYGDLRKTSEPFLVSLKHFNHGPALEIKCSAFAPTDEEQLKLWEKTASGWQSRNSPSCCLEDTDCQGSLYTYIESCKEFCLRDITNKWLEQFLGNVLSTDKLLQVSLSLLVANRMLMKNWRVLDNWSHAVDDEPAPRVLQSQLNIMLEQYVVDKERELLCLLHDALLDREFYRSSPDHVFAAVIIFLTTVELDTWRLMYWLRHKEEGYTWRHPESPQKLIERNIFCVNGILATMQATMDVPPSFREVAQRTRALSEAIHYEEQNDRSLQGSFVRFAFAEKEFATIHWDTVTGI